MAHVLDLPNEVWRSILDILKEYEVVQNLKVLNDSRHKKELLISHIVNLTYSCKALKLLVTPWLYRSINIPSNPQRLLGLAYTLLKDPQLAALVRSLVCVGKAHFWTRDLLPPPGDFAELVRSQLPKIGRPIDELDSWVDSVLHDKHAGDIFSLIALSCPNLVSLSLRATLGSDLDMYEKYCHPETPDRDLQLLRGHWQWEYLQSIEIDFDSLERVNDTAPSLFQALYLHLASRMTPLRHLSLVDIAGDDIESTLSLETKRLMQVSSLSVFPYHYSGDSNISTSICCIHMCKNLKSFQIVLPEGSITARTCAQPIIEALRLSSTDSLQTLKLQDSDNNKSPWTLRALLQLQHYNLTLCKCLDLKDFRCLTHITLHMVFVFGLTFVNNPVSFRTIEQFPRTEKTNQITEKCRLFLVNSLPQSLQYLRLETDEGNNYQRWIVANAVHDLVCSHKVGKFPDLRRISLDFDYMDEMGRQGLVAHSELVVETPRYKACGIRSMYSDCESKVESGAVLPLALGSMSS